MFLRGHRVTAFEWIGELGGTRPGGAIQRKALDYDPGHGDVAGEFMSSSWRLAWPYAADMRRWQLDPGSPPGTLRQPGLAASRVSRAWTA